MIYNVVPISAVQQSDSVIHIYTFFFNILFHYGLSQDIVYSSLCYTLGPCCSPILNVIICIYQPQIPGPSLSLPPPLRNHKSVLYGMWHFFICFYKGKDEELQWWDRFRDLYVKHSQMGFFISGPLRAFNIGKILKAIYSLFSKLFGHGSHYFFFFSYITSFKLY